MSVRSLAKVAFRGIAVALLVTSLHVPVFGMPVQDESSRMATYDDPRGEIAFALSLTPQMDAAELASDVVVFFDTSASQTGVYKRDSLATLENFLASLNDDDRVKIVAIDLDPVVLTPDFAQVDSNEISVAIENLRQRDALGSTDMELMLKSTAEHFAASGDRNRNAVYIGDGISRASLLNQSRLTDCVKQLVDNRIAFSSYAIGPERNIELLAALSNNTGGNVFIDSNDEIATRTGAIGLAQTVHGQVFWPTLAEMPQQFSEVLPAMLPPMRSDRDTVLVGTLSDRGNYNVTINGVLNGQQTSFSWTTGAEASNHDFAFLTQLIADARKDGGISMPTIGSEGLREAARIAQVASQEFSEQSKRALAAGNPGAAQTLASAALARDPSNTEAIILTRAANYRMQEDDPFGGSATPPAGADPFSGAPVQEAPAAPAGGDPFGGEAVQQDPFGGAPAAPAGGNADPFSAPVQVSPAPPSLPADAGQVIEPPMAAAPAIQEVPVIESTDDTFRMVAPSGGVQSSEIDQLIRDASPEAQDMLFGEEARRRVITDMTRKQVEVELGRAREELRFAPDDAIERLKSMVEVLDTATEVDPNVRQDLRNRLVSALQSSIQEKLRFDNRRMLIDQRNAAANEQRETLRRYASREEQIASLINRFDYLLEEKNYDEAYNVALAAYDFAPNEVSTVAADESGRIARIATLSEERRRQRQLSFVEALYEVEEVRYPLPSMNRPMIFPDPLVWAEKVAKREKYQDIRLAGNDNDERILSILDEPASFSYDDVPFEDVMRDLRIDYGINVILDTSAREDSLAMDEPITFEVSQIRLKNALRLMLKDYNATFIVRDEVMKIISLDVASDPENFVTNVYNVGDLVAPRQFRGGGGGGFGGGGLGGGGRGGGGFGGGGLGGGGLGGGGGGGIFCIEDAEVGTAGDNVDNSPARIIEVNIPRDTNPAEAWTNFLSENEVRPRDLRLTAAEMMENDPQQVVGIIKGAMRTGQSDPTWMIEGLVIAMQVADYPQSEIERALMSTIDLSDNLDDAMVAAKYMVDNNMERRGIHLLQDISTLSNVRPEPYVIGLDAAQRINDIAAIQWATVGILGQAWPEHREIVKTAIYAAEAARDQLKQEGRDAELAEFNRELDQALYRDCIIKVSWTGDADVDLMVEEPGGSLCTRQNPRTTAGGVMMGDAYTQENQAGESVEYYVLPKGFSGDYKLYIRKVWGEVTAGKVTVAIYHHFRTENQASQQKQLEVDENGITLVNFRLEEGRRTESLEENVLASVSNQEFLSPKAMNQVLDSMHSSSASSEYYESGGVQGGAGQAGNGNQFAPPANNLRRSTVGYRPEITTIPEGAFMSATATTSDRLYVLVGAQPVFNLITRVDTFNILGGAGNAAGGGAGIGGLGGGGGGLGGGGLGGGLGGGGLGGGLGGGGGGLF
ncbi:MAG: hypothetical protein AAF456_22660 [Planctomycetota bacterium]